MNKNYLIKELSKLSAEDALQVLAQSQETRARKRKVPQSRIDALKTRYQELTETNSIRFPVKLSGEVRLHLDWEGPGYCYYQECELITAGDPVGEEFFQNLISGEEAQYSPYASQFKEKLEAKGATIIQDIEDLAAEYDVDSEELVDEIVTSRSVKVKRLSRSYKRAKRRR